MELNGPIDTHEALTIYLRDHHAGAQGGTRLARRAAGNQSERADELTRLADEIEQDAHALDQVMAEVGVEPDPVKDAGAAVGEWLGRFKLNGQLTGSSPLSPVVELEALMSAIFHKRHLWVTLRDVAEVDVASVDLDDLVARADDQIEALRPLWRDATSGAFA